MNLEELNRIDKRAQQFAVKHKSEYVTLEHLLIALLGEKTIMNMFKEININLPALKKDLIPLLGQIPQIKQSGIAPVRTGAFERTKERACDQVQSSGRDKVSAADLLVALYEESDSPLICMLANLGLNRDQLVCYLTIKEAGLTEGTNQPAATAQEPNALEAYTVNLTEKAKNGKIDPLVGRIEEMSRMLCILSRRKKNNPLLVGEAGVGKTLLAKTLASELDIHFERFDMSESMSFN